jgi:general secretion pathway protein K
MNQPTAARRRKTSGGRPAGRGRQRGVALIIALILVALATVLATKLSYDSWIERRRSLGMLAAEQALHFGMGAEALAADVLTQNLTTAGAQVTLSQAWAQPSQPLPITPENDPEGEPIGTLQGGLEDMQGRFNLNNLGAFGQDGKPDPLVLAQFQRLLQSVGVDPKYAGMARDWIDADDIPGSPDGAEDSIYTAQTPPYLTGNYPMTSPSELMNLPGFGADNYRKIAPYVTALPDAKVKINICTAPAQVLESLAPDLVGEYSNNPQVLVAGRKTGCFPEPQAFQNILGKSAATTAQYYGTTSTYFRLTTRVTLGTTEFTLYSLLFVGAGKVSPLLRTFGTP